MAWTNLEELEDLEADLARLSRMRRDKSRGKLSEDEIGYFARYGQGDQLQALKDAIEVVRKLKPKEEFRGHDPDSAYGKLLGTIASISDETKKDVEQDEDMKNVNKTLEGSKY